jgi:urease subunit gamma
LAHRKFHFWQRSGIFFSAIYGGYNRIAPICGTAAALSSEIGGQQALGRTCNVRNPTDVRSSVPFTGRSCKSKIKWNRRIEVETGMQLTPREFDKLMIYMVAEVALKRKAKGLKLNYPEAVAIISAAALDGARAGKAIEDVAKEAREVLTKDDVMDGVADLIPMVQVEAVFTDGSRLVTVHTPIQ